MGSGAKKLLKELGSNLYYMLMTKDEELRGTFSEVSYCSGKPDPETEDV